MLLTDALWKNAVDFEKQEVEKITGAIPVELCGAFFVNGPGVRA
jgi:carotenoid cleavage dioxygenase-like enzyme